MSRSLILLVLIIITGCTPVYSDRYSYNTPASQEGRMCVNSCIGNKSICTNNCNQIEQSCISSLQWMKIGGAIGNAMTPMDSAHFNQRRSFSELESDYNQGSWRCSAQKRGCQANCEVNYNDCYQNCGGEVLVSTYCSAFCR